MFVQEISDVDGVDYGFAEQVFVEIGIACKEEFRNGW